MARYGAGETLASIARTYDCSPPAISYVVSRSRARHPGAQDPAAAASLAETQLVKARAVEPEDAGSGSPPPAANGRAAALGGDLDRLGTEEAAKPAAAAGAPGASSPVSGRPPTPEADEVGRNGIAERGAPARPTPPEKAGEGLNGTRPGIPGMRPGTLAPSQTNGADPRRKLHLTLGNTAGASGALRPPEAPAPARPEISWDRAAGAANSGAQPGFAEAVPTSRNDLPPRREGVGSFIDQELRARVDADIAAFLAAFDAAMSADTQESRSALRDATDRLLRAGARTRIELERLEARLPLPPRTGEAAWRHR